MRLDFASCLDGTMNITKKPPLDVVFVIDTSGSMQESFPDDPDRRSKLEVAQNCMMKLIDQLDTNDRVGLVSFTDNPKDKYYFIHHLRTIEYPLTVCSVYPDLLDTE